MPVVMGVRRLVDDGGQLYLNSNPRAKNGRQCGVVLCGPEIEMSDLGQVHRF